MDSVIANLLSKITIEIILKVLVVYFCIVWILLIIWVIKDISIRTNNTFFQIICIGIILFGTPLCIFLYLALRPKRTLYDKYYDYIEDDLNILYELIEEKRKQKKENFQIRKIPKKEINKKKIELAKENTSSKISNLIDKI